MLKGNTKMFLLGNLTTELVIGNLLSTFSCALLVISMFKENSIDKHTYALNTTKNLSKKFAYDVIGCDTDACILATAFKLFDENYEFRVLSDYCFSSGGKEVHDSAVEIMKRNFGTAVI